MKTFATIELAKGQGIETIILPIFSETTTGLICQTGSNESPAKKFFPFKSPRSTIISHKHKHAERP